MLDRIPPEVLSLITYHLLLPDPLPPIPLLQTCSAIHDALLPSSNPRLYSRLFRARFDVRAPRRRGGRRAVEAKQLTAELERRVRALKSLKERVRRNDLRRMTDGEVWVVYVLLVENDGKNMGHLDFLPKFLHLFHNQRLLPACLDAGYPTESVLTSLVMWIAWLYSHDPSYRRALAHSHADSTHGSESDGDDDGSSSGRGRRRHQHICHVDGHSIEDRAEQQYMLRAYVFAAHKYSMYFAPWVAVDVPFRAPPALPAPPGEAFRADVEPVDRGVEVEWYGGKIRLSPPVLAHAAILRFFDTRGEEDDDMDDADLDQDEDGEEEVVGNGGGLSIGNGTGIKRDEALDIDDDDSDDDDKPEPNTMHLGTRRPNALLESTSHDRDWSRLLLCANPRSTPGMPRAAWRGAFAGAWEGNFSFFEFEAYSNMLAGEAREVYTGPFGAQRQVWKLTETYVRRRARRGVGGMEGREGSGEGLEVGEAADGEGGQGGMHEDDEGNMAIDGDVSQTTTTTTTNPDSTAPAAPFPLRGPSTNANFPTDTPSTVSGGLASARAEELALQATIRQQVEAMDGYECVPEPELDATLARAEELGVEMLLTGTGHSAWGKFLLRGRVRAWDGMASLVKEYSPNPRGKWLYRGYVLAGDVMVGRWRDTHTPDEYIGYEGTYVLNRRR